MTNIIILDNHIQALGCLRLTEKLECSVNLYYSYKICISRFSKYCKRFVVYKNSDDLLCKLLANEKEDSILIPTSDKMIKFCMDNYRELNKRFKLIVMDINNTILCYNKVLLYKRLENYNLDIPQTEYPVENSDINYIFENIEYPVIIKPAVMYTFKKLTGKKAFLCKNKTELTENYYKAKISIPEKEIMIQEYISGGAENLYSYCAFVVRGTPYGIMITNRKRQYPMDFGNSTTYAISVKNITIQSITEKLLKKLNYTGICEIEFMYDKKNKKYKLLEINPRFWKWHGLAQKMGINYIKMIIQYLNDEPIDNIQYREGIIWRERISDTVVGVKEIIKGKLNLGKFIKSNRYPVQYACWDKKDPLPAIMYVLMLPFLKLKRN